MMLPGRGLPNQTRSATLYNSCATLALRYLSLTPLAAHDQTSGMPSSQASAALKSDHHSIAALVFEIKDAAALGSGRVHLLPAGEFSAVDGRPGNLTDGKLKAWKLTPEIAARVAAKVAARKTPLVVDYEHQSLRSMFNGAPAPAAGWFNQVEFDAATGLSATGIDWTEQAQKYIANREYRFASAVFTYDKKTGEVTELLNAALTNNPGLDGLAEVTALAAKHFHSTTPPEDSMKQLLIAALALNAAMAAAATDDSLAALVKDARTQADKVPALEAEVAMLRASQFDAAKHVPMEQLTRLQGELQAALTKVNEHAAKASEAEVAALIDGAMAKGKIVESTKHIFTEMGKKDIGALKAFIDKQPEIAALASTQSKGKAPESGVAAASFDVPPGASADTERAALHTQALAYQAQNKTDYVAAYKAVGGK